MTQPHSARLVFRRQLASPLLARYLEAHSGICGFVLEQASSEVEGQRREFDGAWFSSFTVSGAMGHPDDGRVAFSDRLRVLEDIVRATAKPVLVDLEDGGPLPHCAALVRRLVHRGAAGAVIEDKQGLKANSLSVQGTRQLQDELDAFCAKIATARAAAAAADPDFCIIARVESLITGAGMADAQRRGTAYLGAGADAIMIHSRSPSPDEVLEYARWFRASFDAPLVVAPSTYCTVKEEELQRAGVSLVLYANQLLRSAYLAMLRTARTILRHGRAWEAEEQCLAIADLLALLSDGQ